MAFLSTRRRLPQGGGYSFVPQSIGGLAAWFDSTTLPSSGTVSQWQDSSGQVNTLSGSGEAAKLNGRNAVTGAGMAAEVPAMASAYGSTLFVVASVPSFASQAAIASIDYTTQMFIDGKPSSTTYNLISQLSCSATTGEMRATHADGLSTTNSAALGAVAISSPFIACVSQIYYRQELSLLSLMTARVNGVVRYKSDTSIYPQTISSRFFGSYTIDPINSPSAAVFPTNIRIGVSGLLTGVSATIGEVVAYSRELSIGEQDEVIAYLSEKWQIRTSYLAYEAKAYPIYRTTGSSTQPSRITVKDSVVDRHSPLTQVTDYRVEARPRLSNVPVSSSFSSSNTNVISSPDSRGIATYASDGTATFSATMPDGSTESVVVSTSTSTPGQKDVFVEFALGSAARSAVDGIDSRISGKTSSAKPLFSTLNNSTPTYVRNASCWAAGVDMTCCSPWNSTGGQNMAGVLISPRHVLFAAHYQIAAGATIRFITAGGEAATRTVSATAKHPSYRPYFPDIAIGLLDSNVPGGISFAKILPAAWSSKFPNVATDRPIPCMVVDSEKKALVADLEAVGSTFRLAPPGGTQRAAFFENMVVGDSGSPVFLVLSGEPVLLGVVTYGGAGEGTFIGNQKDSVNAVMASLGGGYQLTEADLSGFYSY